MATELVLLGTAGAPLPVPGRAGISSALVVDGRVAERARVRELILSHYLPAEPGAVSEQDWGKRAGLGFSGRTIAGRDGLRRTLPGTDEAGS